MQWQIRGSVVPLNRPRIMGILNVTPDSFSDGGLFDHPERAVARALAMEGEGADLIDVGAESTRPGAAPVSAQEEWERLAPVLRRLSNELRCPLSVDTRKGEVARRALKLGAAVINDVSAGEDPLLLEAVGEYRAGLVVMHGRGTPKTMMEHARYQDVVQEVRRELQRLVGRALEAGIPRENICIDPGFGFAKTPAQNYELLQGLESLRTLSYPLLVGLSRKRMLRELVGEDRRALDAASVTAALLAVQKGARILRLHEVAEARRILGLWLTLTNKK